MASNLLYEPFESRPFSVPTALQGVCALRCQVSLRGVALISCGMPRANSWKMLIPSSSPIVELN